MKKTVNDKFNLSLSSIIDNSDLSSQKQTIGIVKAYGDGVVKVTGLDDAQAGELIDLGNNQFGLALNLEKEQTGIVVLGDAFHLKAGATVKKTGQILSINVSESILGRTVDVLGRSMDGKSEISVGKQMLLEKKAPGIMPRKSVTVPLHTGLKAIDALVPIGRGQRELIIGDRSTGKTAVALGAILNQSNQDVICVYVSIGQKRSSLAQTIDILKKNKAMDYTTIVAATASVSAAEQFLAPYAGQAIAEYFLEKGKDVLIIFDDLTKHAQAYREISLLLKRPSGREAYPGDVFYLHSRLLERACRLNDDNGGGSITALPIIETQDNDVSAFIPTNVISITDGQIYLESDLFNSGMKPAINVGLSVSRVGGAAQLKATKQVAGTMKLDLAQFRELQAFAQFSSDLDDKTKAQLDRGERVNSILKQGWDEPLKFEEQVVIIYAAVKGYLDLVELDNIQKWEELYLEYFKNSYSSVLANIVKEQKLLDKTEEELIEAIKTFNSMHPELLIETQD
ncbi:F0F1 ATP synthase subunit alpha [Candidatus Woesebacteria bacterium]|nr:F0F1 ATP synthase subunit alpha [Candidatus Woesebacteria bacterium]